MKPLIVLIGLMVVGCASTPTMKSVAGTYEFKEDRDTLSFVFLENGMVEYYENGEKEDEFKWTIVNREIHCDDEDVSIYVLRINKDKSITYIADIEYGKRTDLTKEEQETYKTPRELTSEEKDIVGTYEQERDNRTTKWVFLKNDIGEWYLDGKKALWGEWTIVNREIHFDYEGGSSLFSLWASAAGVLRINEDKSITYIARIVNEKRTDLTKEKQETMKKIK